MKKLTMLKLLTLSLILSSCGLIERFKTPEQPTDSKESTADVSSASTDGAAQTDDLFLEAMEESNANSTGTDAPTNISQTDTTTDSELKSLEDEFSANGPRESVIKESSEAISEIKPIEQTTQESTPVVVEEVIPEIRQDIAEATPMIEDGGTLKSYKVKSGETLMQIAFKIYGDISKWKDLKKMNSDKVSHNHALKAGSELKYMAPSTPFVWNPSGNPYLIKNGETLGIISNNVYATPKKWKAIWENNKPMIVNPNVIYAGFTLYYKKQADMANYVQEVDEEIVADNISNSESAPQRIESEEVESVQNSNEIPQIDEEVQTL